MNILILEDDKYRLQQFTKKLIGHVVTTCMTVDECISLLKQNKYDLCFLDHDLGDEIFVESTSGTGYEVALWIAENKDKAPNKIIIHSWFNRSAIHIMREFGCLQDLNGVIAIVGLLNFLKITDRALANQFLRFTEQRWAVP